MIFNTYVTCIKGILHSVDDVYMYKGKTVGEVLISNSNEHLRFSFDFLANMNVLTVILCTKYLMRC